MDNQFVQFLQNKGLYDKIEINQKNIFDLISLVGGEERIQEYCTICKRNSVFTMNPIMSVISNGYGSQYINLSEYLLKFQRDLGVINDSTKEKANWRWKAPLTDEATRMFVFSFKCTMNPEHTIDYIVLAEGNTFKKIGQSPSVADLTFPELDEYRKVITPDLRREFGRAIGLFASGIGAGSYVYLRRILEALLMQAKADAGNAIDEDAFAMARVGDKITMLREYLPKMLTENSTVYGILSKGIHELKEEECLAYFPVVKDCIYMILDEWEDMRRKREKEQTITSELSKIASRIK